MADFIDTLENLPHTPDDEIKPAGRIEAEEALEVARRATCGPWRVVEAPLEVTELGAKKNMRPRTFLHVMTGWFHGQLKAPVDIPSIGHTPYWSPNHHTFWINEKDAHFVAQARTLVPALAKGLLAAEARAEAAERELAALRAAVREHRKYADRECDEGRCGYCLTYDVLTALLPPEASLG